MITRVQVRCPLQGAGAQDHAAGARGRHHAPRLRECVRIPRQEVP